MAPKINKGNEHSITESGILFKLLADELLLLLHTKEVSQKSRRGRHSKKIFLQGQQRRLKEIIDKITAYIASQHNKKRGSGNFIKTLLSAHENMISYYRESSSAITAKSHKDTNDFINRLIEKHEEMAWALRTQLK